MGMMAMGDDGNMQDVRKHIQFGNFFLFFFYVFLFKDPPLIVNLVAYSRNNDGKSGRKNNGIDGRNNGGNDAATMCQLCGINGRNDTVTLKFPSSLAFLW